MYDLLRILSPGTRRVAVMRERERERAQMLFEMGDDGWNRQHQVRHRLYNLAQLCLARLYGCIVHSLAPTAAAEKQSWWIDGNQIKRISPRSRPSCLLILSILICCRNMDWYMVLVPFLYLTLLLLIESLVY